MTGEGPRVAEGQRGFATVRPAHVRTFLQSVRIHAQPYLVRIAADFVIAAALWAVLFGFHWICGILPIPGIVSEWIGWIHQLGTVGIYSILTTTLIYDVIRLKSRDQD